MRIRNLSEAKEEHICLFENQLFVGFAEPIPQAVIEGPTKT